MEQKVPFRLREPSKRREPTKEEKARVSYLRYVDEPSGYLEFELTEHYSGGRRSKWRDTKTRRLEDYLNDIIAAMIVDAADQIERHAAVEQRKKEYENAEARRRQPVERNRAKTPLIWTSGSDGRRNTSRDRTP